MMKRYCINILRALVNRPMSVVYKEKYIPTYIPVLRSDLLRGRRALVTGGSSGIGFGIAEAYLQAGASVVITGRDEQKLQSVKEKLMVHGDVSTAILDVTKLETINDFLSRIGTVDILVNNAGYVGGGVFGSTTEIEYDKVLDTNLKGAYFVAQQISQKWIKEQIKGNILNVCSASSLRPGNTPYVLSKWGMRALTVGMAKKLISHGIIVNGIAPGCTNTSLFCTDEKKGIENYGNPSRRMVTIQEVANFAVILVSDMAKMVVGDILYVTGGAGITTFDDIPV